MIAGYINVLEWFISLFNSMGNSQNSGEDNTP